MDTSVEQLLCLFPVQAEVDRFLTQSPAIFIDGVFVVAHGNDIPVYEPSTGRTLGCIAGSSSEDVDAAVGAARRALAASQWRQMKPLERQRLLMRIADLLEAEATIVAQLECLDCGKAISGCLPVDVMGSVDLLRYMSGLAAHAEGATRQLSVPGDFLAYTLKEPVGVIACIVPWNFPLNTAIWKTAAAMAAGCTVVVKPDHNTSLSTLYFADLCTRAGLPSGVFNVVTGLGSDVGSKLVSHPGIDRVSFTGSTSTGRLVGSASGRALKPTTLELGGKSPMIVCADANVSAVAAAARSSVFFNAGQVCSAGSRIYAERRIFDDVVHAVRNVASELRLGPGLDPNTEVGPVTTEIHQSRICNFVERARKAGGHITEGANVPNGQGYYVRPTVIVPGRADDECVREEIFGPVVAIVCVDNLEAAVLEANASQYALAASVWTQDLARGLDLVRRIDAGTVWVNTHDVTDPAMPFGGFKASGFGKDLGREQFEECFRTKAITVAL